MKLGHLTEPVFNEALTQLASLALPPKAAYRVAKLLSRIKKENQHYHELREALIRRHACLDEKGQIKTEGLLKSIVFQDELAKEKFIEEHQALYNLEVKLDSFPLSLLGDQVKIEPRSLALLNDLIEEKDSEPSGATGGSDGSL
jgi:hypothetical protein